VNDMQWAIEAKATAWVTADHLKGLRALLQDHPRIEQRLVICLEPHARKMEDGTLILPVREFCAQLAGGQLF